MDKHDLQKIHVKLLEMVTKAVFTVHVESASKE